MRQRKVLVVDLSLAILSIFGCGGSPTGTGTGPGTPLSAAEYCRTFADSYCGRIASCAGWPDYMRDDCAAQYRADCDSIGRAVEQGRASYDSGAAAACLSAVNAADCDGVNDAVLGCRAAVVGLEAVGASCVGSVECAAGAYCAISDQCPGVCTKYGAAQDSCGTYDKVCSPELNCVGGVCAAKAKAGESCGLPAYPECESAYYCASNGQCAARLADGDACLSYTQCRIESFCLRVLNGACGKLPVAGETCAQYECYPGLFCDPTTAKCIPRIKAGESCVVYRDPFSASLECERGSYCEGAEGGARCSLFLGLGATCDTSASRCSPDLYYCEKQTHQCTALKQAGEPCTGPVECTSLFCDGTSHCFGVKACP